MRAVVILILMVYVVSANATEGISADGLYTHAVNQSTRASNLERRGHFREAIDAYEAAGQLCEASLAETAAEGAESRGPDVYFRCATSFLHAGRLLTKLREEGPHKDEDLRKATTYLEQVEKVETERAQQANQPINPEVWRVRNAAGYACFLRGELARARVHYKAVLEMNPGYKPAEQAITEINRFEQQQNELFTPQGRTLHKEKTRKALRDIVDALKLVRDIIALGR
ncbi:MAG: hypothetical protein ACJ8HQ_04085 [Chthoniobacterales bacterium]